MMPFLPSNHFVVELLLLLTPISLTTTPSDVVGAQTLLPQKIRRDLTQKIRRDLTQKIHRNVSPLACIPKNIYGDYDFILQVHSSEYEPVCTCREITLDVVTAFTMENRFPADSNSTEEVQAWIDSLNAMEYIEGSVDANSRAAKGCTNHCSFCFGNGTYCALFRQDYFKTSFVGFNKVTLDELDEFIALGFGEDEEWLFVRERLLVYKTIYADSTCLDVLENSDAGDDATTGEICLLLNSSWQSDDGVAIDTFYQARDTDTEWLCSVLYKGETCKSCSFDLTTGCVSLDCTNLLADSISNTCNKTTGEEFPGLLGPFFSIFEGDENLELSLGTCNLTTSRAPAPTPDIVALAPTPAPTPGAPDPTPGIGALAPTPGTSSGSVHGPWMIAMAGSLSWCLVSLTIW